MQVRVRKFQKRKEDFVCENCGENVRGNGYTNHCPRCLWSKHVDIFPGDRLENCNGLMQPVTLQKKGKDYVITHKCIKCGYSSRVRTDKDDNFDTLIKISKNDEE